MSLIWALFWDGCGIEGGILEAYEICVEVPQVVLEAWESSVSLNQE